jgi:hypothetical protein
MAQWPVSGLPQSRRLTATRSHPGDRSGHDQVDRVSAPAILPHSPADYVRRPTVPAESPTLGLGHLQFEALITTARLSTNRNDFALVALLGLLGLRIFEACGASVNDLGE